MRSQLFIAALAFSAFALPDLARADDDMCVDRPGLDTPACTLAKGRVMLEMGLAGWDHSTTATGREDTVTLADTTARIGLGHATEVQVGVGGWGHQRVRGTGRVGTAHGMGDATVALRHGFGSEDDARVALQIFATLPIGRQSIGAGDWGAGLIVPVALPLPSGFELSLSPEVDAAVNGDGHGRHLAWGSSLSLSHDVAKGLSLTGEIAAWRDDDPAGHSTDARLAASLAWRAGRSLQLDIEFDKGIAAGAPDHALMIGFARQF